MRLWKIVLVLALALSPALIVRADQKDQRLEVLFRELRVAPNPAMAMIVESEIWRIWAETGDEDRDKVFDLGSKAMAIGDYPTAFAVFSDLTRLAPNFAEGWNKLATVEYLMGNYQLSLHSIDKTLELEPRHFGALSGLGLVNMELHREEAALDAFERVLVIYPMSESARANADYVRAKLKEKAI
jgi:tetratricopeptide (TPR) repeat protein